MKRYLLVVVLGGLFWCGLTVADPPAADPPAELSREDAQDLIFLAPKRPLLVRLYVQVDGKPYAYSLDTWVKELFRFLDRDGDGKLSRAEAERAPNAKALVQRLQQGGGFLRSAYQATPLRELDEDGDGKVSLQELTNYYRNSELVAPHLVGLPTSAYPPEALTNALFALFDTNKDGRLTSNEMARAAEVLAKLDADDDETLSPGELLPGLTMEVPQRPPVGMPAMPAAPTTDGAFFLASSRFDMVQQLMARYDRNKDNRLSQDEIDLDDATFKRLDTNHDGELDALELLKLVGKKADLELIVRLGKVPDKQAAVELIVPPKDNDFVKTKTTSQGLTLTFGTTQLDVRLPPTDNRAQAMMAKQMGELQRVQKQQIAAVFNTLDPDKRGYLDKETLNKPQGQFLLSVFDVADRDGDGKLTLQELTALMELDQKVATCSLSFSAGEGGRGLFELMDANHDGRLSLTEMRTACQRLGENGTDIITRATLPRKFELTVSQGAANALGGRQFGALRGGGFGSALPQGGAAAPLAPLWFRKMDANGDGDVSRREWLGTPDDFNKIDLDGDGVISLEEALKFEETQKK